MLGFFGTIMAMKATAFGCQSIRKELRVAVLSRLADG